MSASDITLGSIGADAGIPSLNVAEIPANIRNGNNAAKQAYTEGLAFENVLVNELSQQLAASMYGGGGTDPTSSSDAGDSSSGAGLLGGAGAYASLIPQALTSSIMSGGGVGMAEEFARELDPSLRAPAATDVAGNSAASNNAASNNAASSGNAAAGQVGV